MATRYFIQRDADGNIIGVGATTGAEYPDEEETDLTGFENALSKAQGIPEFVEDYKP